MKDKFCFFGRTISAISIPFLISRSRKRDLQRLLKIFRETEFPYFLDTINPNAGGNLGVYLKDKSPINRDLETFIMLLNSAEGTDSFNYAESPLRPLLRRLAKRARPFLVPILFLKPCLFFRLRLVYFTVTFIKIPFP